MTRQPWSLPTRAELWHVLIGVGVGFVLALALAGIGGPNGLLATFIVMLMVAPLALLLINVVAWAREDKERQQKFDEEQKERERDLWWLRDANRSATNKHIGLAWTGRHPRRR